MEVAIDVPKAEDFEVVNQLAKQVHSLHVEWRPDLFLDVKQENENAIKMYEKFGFKVRSIAYSMKI